MATSAFFRVSLPVTITDGQLVKVYEWATQNCLKSSIIQGEDAYTIVLQRNDEKDLRARQRLMLTNLKNWGIETCKLPKGWVKLITERDYIDISTNFR